MGITLESTTTYKIELIEVVTSKTELSITGLTIKEVEEELKGTSFSFDVWFGLLKLLVIEGIAKIHLHKDFTNSHMLTIELEQTRPKLKLVRRKEYND